MGTLSVAAKLRLAFFLIVILLVGAGFFSINRLDTVNAISTEMDENWMPSIVTTSAIHATTSKYRIAESLHVVSDDEAEWFLREHEMENYAKETSNWRLYYEKLISSDDEKAIYREFAKDYEDYLAGTRKVIDLSRRLEKAEAAQALRDSGVLFDRFSSALVRLVELNQAGGEVASKRGDMVFTESKMLLQIVMAGVVVFALALMAFFDRHISRPIAEVSGLIERLARGDLDIAVKETHRADEIGHVLNATMAITVTLRDMAADLRELIEAARGGVLSTRVDADRHAGEFGVLLAGVNELIETLARPLFEVASVMQKLAAGDLEGRMVGAYDGDLRALKANVNRSFDMLVTLLNEVGTVANQMAGGNLAGSVAGAYQGEFAVIKANINRAIAQLRETLQEVAENSGQVATAATQTAASAKQVAHHSEQQLLTLSDVAGAISQTAAAVNDISSNAERGSGLVRDAAGLAEGGRVELERMVEAVERIAASNTHIGQITDRISRIADKTHVLSLNAGIEAARAGDQGLGFGIVAQQIGRLAEEAASAVRDIAGLINAASQSVSGGVTAARAAHGAMERIVEAARDSEGTVQNIASAIAEQASAVQSLSEQVSHLYGAGEQNASAADEINATMSDLAMMVDEVSGQLAKFVLA